MFSRGFTLVELIVTMIVVGIMVAAVLPRFSGNTGFEEREFRDRLVAGLRYAQKSAIAARRTTCVAFSAAPATASFRISTDNGAANCSVGTDLLGPDGSPLVLAAPGNVSFTTLPPDVIFDAAGRPESAGTVNVSGLDSSLTIRVEVETGYVH